MPSRKHRARTAEETLAITAAGRYRSPAGNDISLRDAIDAATHNTRTFTPADLPLMRDRAAARIASRPFTTTFAVTNETTFAAARRLVAAHGSSAVAALNFASAKNPGGGFLGGSQAQEESLARASALYACLLPQTSYYEANRHHASLLYTDHLIYSPHVPVFRDDDDHLLDAPWQVTLLTAPAPNAGALATNDPAELPKLEPAFRRRIEFLLATAVAHDQAALVLGAWGCGVFRNDPAMVASLFAESLLHNGPYARAFHHITFAILDPTGTTIAPFTQTFGKPNE